MNRDIYPYIQRHRALNSGLRVFPATDFLPRPEGSSHSFYLKVTEGFPCAGHDSKYKDGTVNETDRASCTLAGVGVARDGRGNGSIKSNKQGNKHHYFRQR